MSDELRRFCDWQAAEDERIRLKMGRFYDAAAKQILDICHLLYVQAHFDAWMDRLERELHHRGNP